MPINECVKQIFERECRGRNKEGKEVLKKPITVKVKIYAPPYSPERIFSKVECRYSPEGYFGIRCNASNPEEDGKNCRCPYVFQIPYDIDYARGLVIRAEKRGILRLIEKEVY